MRIKRVDNGYILSNNGMVEVFENGTDNLATLREMTYSIWEQLGYTGSKHDELRLWCVIKDKEGNEVS